MEKTDYCELCKRSVAKVTKHHLIPVTRHKNKRNKKIFDRKEVHERVLWICRLCHSHVHATLTEKQLEHDYNTADKLMSHPEISKFVDWLSAKPDSFRVPVRENKNKGK